MKINNMLPSRIISAVPHCFHMLTLSLCRRFENIYSIIRFQKLKALIYFLCLYGNFDIFNTFEPLKWNKYSRRVSKERKLNFFQFGKFRPLS